MQNNNFRGPRPTHWDNTLLTQRVANRAQAFQHLDVREGNLSVKYIGPGEDDSQVCVQLTLVE